MALSETAVDAIVTHMNEDHADAVLGYVHRFAALPSAEAASLVSIDASDMIIRATTNGSTEIVRIAFDHPLRDADDARDTLIAMARTA